MNKYRSKLEERVSEFMTNLGVVYEYEDTRIPYTLQHNYTPDFKLVNGIYLETKGFFSSSDRTKMLAVKKQHPELDIRMVFQAPFNKLYKGSKSTYASWCEKHDIKWCAFHDIPIDWLT